MSIINNNIFIYIYVHDLKLNIIYLYFRQNSINSYQSKPFNTNSNQKENTEYDNYNSNCSLESSCSASSSGTSSRSIVHDNELSLEENESDNYEDAKENNNMSEENGNNKSQSSERISSSFIDSIHQLKNDSKMKFSKIPKNNWKEKYNYFDADFTMRAMVNSYNN